MFIFFWRLDAVAIVQWGNGVSPSGGRDTACTFKILTQTPTRIKLPASSEFETNFDESVFEYAIVESRRLLEWVT